MKLQSNLKSLLEDYICPECKIDLKAGKIPQESVDKGYYKEGGWFSRLIGISWNDMVRRYRCPDCKVEFDRFTGEKLEK